MAVELTRPVGLQESAAWRGAGVWAEHVETDASQLALGGERTAVIDRDRALTYSSLASEVGDMAGALHRLGVGPGDAAVVVTDNDCASVVATYAVWRVGGTAVLLHRSAGAADVSFACDAVNAAVLLVAPAAAGLADAGHAPIVKHLDELTGDGTTSPSVLVDPDAARLVVLTSGTTARPKGVIHTANTLRASYANYRAMTDVSPDDRFFLVSPLASMAGVLQVFELAPRLGAVALLDRAWEPASSLSFLVEQGGTFYGGTDNVLARLFDAANALGVTVPLREVAVGGAFLRRDTLDAAEDRGITVIRVYGSSEAPNSTGARPDEPRQIRLADDGAPVPAVEVRLTGDDNELQVRGPHLFRGYLDPRDNVGAFEDDWFRTGDTADIADGRVRVIGRLKEIANRNGRKMSLAEVEEAFRAATAVDDCAAFSVPDAVTGERVAVAVLGDHDIDVEAALSAMVVAGLPRWKLPESVVLHAGPLPRTPTGKVQRHLLSEAAGIVLWRADRLTL